MVLTDNETTGEAIIPPAISLSSDEAQAVSAAIGNVLYALGSISPVSADELMDYRSSP